MELSELIPVYRGASAAHWYNVMREYFRDAPEPVDDDAIYDYMYRNDMTFSYDDLRDYSYYQWYKLRYETSPKSKFAPEPILNDNSYLGDV